LVRLSLQCSAVCGVTLPVTQVSSAAELEGMDAAFITSVTRPDGTLAIPNTRSSVEPLLTSCCNRSLRERVFKLFVSRGDAFNLPIAASILRLRARRAALLGCACVPVLCEAQHHAALDLSPRRFEHHAAWVLEDTMAGDLQTVEKMLMSVWQAAVKRVGEEVAEMEGVMAAEGCDRTDVQPWDYRFWNEKVRKAKYALDDGMLKPYLQLHRLRDGMFWVAQQLYDPRIAHARLLL
jgi:peptidyl-dipeptidase Dcp